MAEFTYGGRKPLDLDGQLTAALQRMNGDTKAAANLFLRWCQSDSEINNLLPDLVTDYVERRIKKLAAKPAKVGAK